MDELRLRVDERRTVGALLDRPAGARALLVLAHGAGAGMRHPFLEGLAGALSRRGIATLRYQFPFLEEERSRPDPPAIAHAAVRAAVTEAVARADGLPVLAGGKSFGGRMTSQAAADRALPGVRGLVFVGFPLHPAGKPGDARAKHLARVTVPMLFLQGTRDDLASLDLLRPVLAALAGRATLHEVGEADHAFAVPRSTGRTAHDVVAGIGDAISAWVDGVA